MDLVLVGGGLQNSLIALAALERRPATRVLLVERDRAVGGNHTWSFHEADLSPWMRALLAPAIVASWPGYTVKFPGLVRDFETAYSTLTSESLAALVAARLPAESVLLGAEAVEVGPRRVVLADGRVFCGELVIDSRGPEKTAMGPCGWQKFLGLEVELAAGTPPPRPILMDATVPQTDGYRFIYTLPLAPDRVLVEDTFYSDRRELDAETCRRDLRGYLEGLGLRAARVVREETGCLPIPLDPLPALPDDGTLRGGFQGGWFHPTTGYSLPAAARLAENLDGIAALDEAHRRQVRFALFLNRLLFRATRAEDRWRVLERFHRLPAKTIARFYALATTRGDRMRILCGKPPPGVTIRRALAAI